MADTIPFIGDKVTDSSGGDSRYPCTRSEEIAGSDASCLYCNKRAHAGDATRLDGRSIAEELMARSEVLAPDSMDADVLQDLITALRYLSAVVGTSPNLVDAHVSDLDLDGFSEVAEPQLLFGQVLTDTESLVLRYLPTHLTVQEIARELCRSGDTIKTHVRHLYIKLDAHSRSEAVQNARASGLLAQAVGLAG
jgi:DNA-binding CsgD family transcriptional regulator